MFTRSSFTKAAGAIGATLVAFSMVFSPFVAPLPAPAAATGSNLVATCDESLYPTPTPPPNPQPGQSSPYSTYGDRFSIAEALQMPTGPSAFDANANVLPDATAPALPPVPDRQFALLDASATPTVVPTPAPVTPKRVVIQAGHWKRSELPYQLYQFSSNGAYVGGVAEWKLNLHVATLAADMLRARGYDVRIVPATIPIGCQADAFVALHADADSDPYTQGYKAAYPRDINNPVNRHLLADMYIEYGAATGLDRNYNITLNMSGYYAFYNNHQPYAVDPSTPMLILEMGYISNYSEREFLSTYQSVAALGVANGVDRFLQGR